MEFVVYFALLIFVAFDTSQAQCVMRTLVPMTYVDHCCPPSAHTSASSVTDDLSSLLALARALNNEKEETTKASTAPVAPNNNYNININVDELISKLLNALLFTTLQCTGKNGPHVHPASTQPPIIVVPPTPSPIQSPSNPGQTFIPTPSQNLAQTFAPAPTHMLPSTPAQNLAPTPIQNLAKTPTQTIAPAPTQMLSPTPTEPLAPTPIQNVVPTPTPTQMLPSTPVETLAPTPIQNLLPTQNLPLLPTSDKNEDPLVGLNVLGDDGLVDLDLAGRPLIQADVGNLGKNGLL